MKLKPAATRSDRTVFYRLPRRVYRGNACHRSTEESIIHLLIDGPTSFHTHAEVRPYLMIDRGIVVGRFALVHDEHLPEYVQVAFFEAMPGLTDVYPSILTEAGKWRSGCRKIVVGFNGHLNYGAGILLNRFDESPVFGLPYSPPWYAGYFAGLFCRATVSFRLPTAAFLQWGAGTVRDTDMQGITFRFMDKKRLRRDIELYTHIDNTTFTNTKYWYWSNRAPSENYELFHPFRHLLREENLVFAEKNGEPVGFLLWYPDFNELVSPHRDLSIVDVLRYRYANPIRTMRLTEVALLPKFRKSPAVLGMMLKVMPYIQKAGYTACEGGFIFEENSNSMVLSARMIERAMNIRDMKPYRRYGIFEGTL